MEVIESANKLTGGLLLSLSLSLLDLTLGHVVGEKLCLLLPTFIYLLFIFSCLLSLFVKLFTVLDAVSHLCGQVSNPWKAEQVSVICQPCFTQSGLSSFCREMPRLHSL